MVNMKNAGLFKEIVENSDNIIIVTDSGFNIQYISSAVEKTFDVQPENLLGKNVFDFVNTDRIAEWKQCLEDQNNSLSDEISLTIGDGRKAYFDVQVTNLIDGFGGLAMHLHDVTERKEREQELIRSNQQMDQVIYKTTHDLKAPLNSALALINLAQEATGEEKTVFIDMVKKSLLKLDTFIEEMNDFFRNDKLALQREVVDLKAVVAAEIEGLRNLPETKRIEFSFKIDGDVAFYSDSMRVRTILTNLLSNAIKYSDLKKKEPFIRISISLNQEFCELRITDNGIGIDPQYLNKIYDLFFRATNHSQGTGLGLFIVRDTIQKLKGTIEVHSALNEGTTFQIQIPNQINQPVLVA
jgi:PAS domain S-box-containing protein